MAEQRLCLIYAGMRGDTAVAWTSVDGRMVVEACSGDLGSDYLARADPWRKIREAVTKCVDKVLERTAPEPVIISVTYNVEVADRIVLTYFDKREPAVEPDDEAAKPRPDYIMVKLRADQLRPGDMVDLQSGEFFHAEPDLTEFHYGVVSEISDAELPYILVIEFEEFGAAGYKPDYVFDVVAREQLPEAHYEKYKE
jgi:hypothetical protein